MTVALWNPEIQWMDPGALRRLQWERVRSQLAYAYANGPFYCWLYDRAGVRPHELRSLEEFSEKVPIFRKDDLRQYQKERLDPFSGLACVPHSQLASIWVSSGTTGMPTMGAYTRSDLQVAIEYLTRSYWLAGYRPRMRTAIVNVNWHWLSPVTWGVFRRLGMRPLLVDFGHAAFARRWARWLRLFHPEAVPSMSTELAGVLIPDALREEGIEPRAALSSVRLISPMGEPLTPLAEARIRKEWGEEIQIRQGAGCGESYCWMFEGACAHRGGHVWGDIGYPEVVDPDTNEPVRPGERGELVATNLQVHGLPYIRFGTEDLVELSPGPCDQGITHPYGFIYGRTGWRVKVDGRTIIPWDVELILQSHAETARAMFSLIKTEPRPRQLVVEAAYQPALTKDPEALRRTIEAEIRERLGVAADLRWVSEEAIPRPVPHKIAKFQDRSAETKGSG